MSIEQLERENTELKAANLKLQNQVKLMETIFESLSEGVVATGLDGEFLVVNPIAQEISGMGPTEGAPEEWSETYGTFYPDKTTVYPSTELPLYKAMQGEETNDVKLVLRNPSRPDGVSISVSGRPLYDDKNSLIGGVIVMRDITELEKITRELENTIDDLQDRNNLMFIVFNSVSDGVIVANEEGEFLFWNPIAEEIVGIGATEGDPEEWSETYGTFYPDQVTPIPSIELPLYQAILGKTVDSMDIFIRNPNRPEGVFISASARPLFKENGDLIGGVVVFRDVTQLDAVKRQLQTTVSELQTQNALMDAIFNSISDGVIVADEDGKYVMFNEKAKAMAGDYPKDVGTTQASEVFGLFQPDGESLFSANELPIARTLKGEHSENVEMFVRNPQLPDGIDISVSASPIYGVAGVIEGGVSVIRDISEHKAIEMKLTTLNEQLTDQSLLLQSIFDSIGDGVFVIDGTGTIIMANPSARKMANMIDITMDPEEWKKKYNFFHLDKSTPFPMEKLPVMSTLRGEFVDNVELFVNNAENPEGIYISVSGTPLLDGDGDHTGGVIIFRDITDRVKRQEALAQAFAQGRLEIVDTILHNIGNAINSVTVGIDTVYNMLADDLLSARLTALAEAMQHHEDNLIDYIENDPQGQKVLPFLLTLSHDFKTADQALRQTVERIRDRTRHIVDIIRTQNSYQGTSGARKDINLADAISDAIKIMQESIDKRQIQVEIDFDNTPEEIRIQESQFHQMLVNLIKNSIEAIDELTRAGELNEVPLIQIRVHSDDDFLNIDIKDNGIGIDPEDIERIFSAGWTTKEHGSGLGLHSSANFVISTGGKIESCSDGKGTGATVRVMLRRTAIETRNREA